MDKIHGNVHLAIMCFHVLIYRKSMHVSMSSLVFTFPPNYVTVYCLCIRSNDLFNFLECVVAIFVANFFLWISHATAHGPWQLLEKHSNVLR